MAEVPRYQIPRRVMLAMRDASTPTANPQAPPVGGGWGAPANDGWSPAAIIGIVAAIMSIMVLIPFIALLLRKNERKRCREVLSKSTPGGLQSSKNSVREEQSLKSILVTKEVQRSS